MGIELELRIRPTREQQRTSAWFLPGSEPARWLEELSRWSIPHRELTLWLIPRGMHDRRPSGLVAVGAESIKASAKCRALQCLSERLYLPTDAELLPRLSDHALSEMFPAGYHYFWLPESGLTKISAAESLRVVDLLTFAHPIIQGRWRHASPGITLVKRLVAIRTPRPADVEAWLADGGGDIAGDQHPLSDLPPVPDEPSDDLLRQTMRSAGQLASQGLGKFAQLWQSMTPPSSGRRALRPSWADKLAEWSGREANRLRQQIEAARNKQLNRLMSMLEKDPDQGLRYAIPFAEQAFRGTHPGSTSLRASTVNFNWGGLFGGNQPASFWNINDEYRRKLTKRYQELAERESNLGRHRRAAYIYAHLLGDLVAAANALRLGGHFQEAAALYQHKLNRKNLAATCLAEGKFFEEAIGLYVELSMFVEAGDLAQQLGDDKRASDLFEQALDAARQRNDYLGAATICREKLSDIPRGRRLLQSGWPLSTAAADCLSTELEWLADLGQPQETLDRLLEVSQQSLPPTSRLIATRVLSSFSKSVTDQRVSAAARVSCLRIVARQLQQAPSVNDRGLLGNISDMHDADRLLRRDCNRFLEQRGKGETVEAPRPATGARTKVKLQQEFSLIPPDTRWLKAIRGRDQIIAVGDSGRSHSITTATFCGDHLSSPYRLHGVKETQDIVLCLLPGAPGVLCKVNGPQTATSLIRTNDTGTIELVGRWYAHDHIVNCCLDFDILWTVRLVVPSLLLESIDVAGMRTMQEIELRRDSIGYPIHMQARSGSVFLAVGHNVLMVKENRVVQQTLRDVATGVCGSLPNSVTRMVVTYEEGADMIYRDDAFCQVRLAHDVYRPVAEFTAGGHLVVAGQRRIEVYATSRQGVELLHAETQHVGEHPVAVLRGGTPREFLVLDTTGVVRVFQVSA